MVIKHTNLQVEPVGIVPKFPYLGASPDGFVSCDCCGEDLIEVKCPHKYHSVDPHTILDTDFFLKHGDGRELQLKTCHAYYILPSSRSTSHLW